MATVAYERDTGRSARHRTGRPDHRSGAGRRVRPDELPAINNALTVERTLDGEKTTITCEVAQHVGDADPGDRHVATDGLIRGTRCTTPARP